MKQSSAVKEWKVRDTHFPVSVFLITLVTLLSIAGIHAILVVEINQWIKQDVWQEAIVIVYWVIVSIGFTLFTRYQMRKSYEKPMKELAKAADAVAHGDFSVYVPMVHTAEKLDYLDVMIMDFNTMVEELGSIEILKTDFFSNVSHEIKTPLATILNYAESLKESDLSEKERQEYLEIMIQTSKRLAELISNILKLNKLEKQVIEPSIEPYDLCEQLCQCALQFEELWEQKNIEFIVDIEDKATIEADAGLLELVWNNLLSNAIKFSEPGGKITLHQTSASDGVFIKFHDTGCGMDGDTMNHIFDKFYQGDTSHSMEGNGLGLALAWRVIQLEGGTIAVESELEAGTTFTIYLPVKRRSAQTI